MADQSKDDIVTIQHPDNPNTSVAIKAFGATVISWKIDGKEQLFLSEKSKLDGTRGIRGGIPLVFPRFGPPGKHQPTDTLPQHGFARSVYWEVLGMPNNRSIKYGLSPEHISDEFRKAWPYDFTLIYTVTLEEKDLKLELSVENTGKQDFEFNVLFHTYFLVPDVSKIKVVGLQEQGYWDKVRTASAPGEPEPFHISGEVDRVYGNPGTEQVLVKDDSDKVIYKVSTDRTIDFVVWNPGPKAAANMTDFGPEDGYKNMICVENGNVAKFKTLSSRAKWTGGVTLTSFV